MALASSNVRGTLTGPGTQDIIRAATGTEFHIIRFQNISGGEVTLKVWIDGTDDVNLIVPKGLALNTDSHVMAIIRTKLGNGEVIKAEANQAGAIVWTDGMDTL